MILNLTLKSMKFDDFRYVECTSAAIEGLKLFQKLHPNYKNKEIQACISKAINFIESIQLPDGSWYLFSTHITYLSYMDICSIKLIIQQQDIHISLE